MIFRKILLSVILILILTGSWSLTVTAALPRQANENVRDTQTLKSSAYVAISDISNIKVRAFSQNAVTGTRGKQVIYVIVLDQKYHPLAGAQAVITVTLPDRQSISYVVAEPSDEYGMIQFDFLFNSRQIGLAIVQVQVAYEGMEAETVTSFRIWK